MDVSRLETGHFLAEHAIDGLLAVDEYGVVIEANPAARTLLGLPADPSGTPFGRPPVEGEEVARAPQRPRP